MLPLILTVLGGLGLVFVFTDTGQTQSDRLSDAFGVPRDWFDVEAVNQYARFGRGVRMVGLALGGLAGFGLAGSFAVRETSTVQRCGSAPRIANSSAVGFASETTSASEIVRVAERAGLPLNASARPPTTLAPEPSPASRGQRDGAGLGPQNVILCAKDEVVFTSSRTQAERLWRRRSAALLLGGLVGFALASVLAERRAPRLVRGADDPYVDTWKKTGRSRAWRTGAGAFAVSQMFGMLESGNSGITVSIVGLVLAVGTALAIGGARARAQYLAREQTFSPMYRRALSDYIPRRAVLGWLLSVLATVSVSVWVLWAGRVGTQGSYLSSIREFWLVVALVVCSQIVAGVSSVAIVRFRASFDDGDARALIADDARRAAAVQRLLGASVFLATSTIMKLMTREVSSGWISFLLFLVSLFGAVLWWSPIGVSKSTAERWKTLVRSTPPLSPLRRPI